MVIPAVVDMRDNVETYPAEPRPVTEDVSCVVKKLEVMNCKIELVNSVGSMKELINVCSPCVVETKLGVERNPEV